IRNAPEIECAALIGPDGAIVSSLWKEPEQLAAIAQSQAFVALAKQFIAALKPGALEQIFIRSEEGYILLMTMGSGAILLATANSRAKLGLIFLEMQRTTNELDSLF